MEIEIIPEDAEGDVDTDALERLVMTGTRKPALIAITHIPTSSGVGARLLLVCVLPFALLAPLPQAPVPQCLG